jgi:hypothetical protein
MRLGEVVAVEDDQRGVADGRATAAGGGGRRSGDRD